MANIVVTETASNISVNSTSNVVTVTNTPANISFATVSAVSNAAVREAISVTDSGGDGSLTYSNATGVINYTGPSASEVRSHFSATSPMQLSSGVISIDSNAVFSGKTTDDLTQGSTNKYFTTSGATVNTDALTEGSTNLYYTTARSNSAIAAYTGAMTNMTGNINTTANISATKNITTGGYIELTDSTTPHILASATNDLQLKGFDGSGFNTVDFNFGNATSKAEISLGHSNANAVVRIAGQLPSSNEPFIQYLANTTHPSKGNIGGWFMGYGQSEDNSSASYQTGVLWNRPNNTFIANNIETNTITRVGNITSSGNIEASYYKGNGSELTGIVSSYGNTQVAAYLPVNTANVQTNNLYVGNRIFFANVQAMGVSGTDGNVYITASLDTPEIVMNKTSNKGNILNARLIAGDELTLTTTASVTGNITGGNLSTGGTLTVGNGASITGNLNVTGNINSETVTDLFVEDRNITLQFGQTGTPSANSQLFVDRGSSSNTYVKWDETGDAWKFSNDGSTEYKIAASTSDLAEGTNLYYTTARANTAIAAYTGALTNLTGNITTTANISGGNILGTVRGAIDSTSNITTTANISGGNVLGIVKGEVNTTSNITTTANISAGNVLGTFIGNITGNVTGSPSSLAGLDTADLAEGTNLYFTNARANAAFVDSLDNITTAISSDSNITTTANISGGNILGTHRGAIDSTSNITTTANINAGGGTLTGILTSNANAKFVNMDIDTLESTQGNITSTANIVLGLGSDSNISLKPSGDINANIVQATTQMGVSRILAYGTDAPNVRIRAGTNAANADLNYLGRIRLEKELVAGTGGSRILDVDTSGYGVKEADTHTSFDNVGFKSLMCQVSASSGSNELTFAPLFGGAFGTTVFLGRQTSATAFTSSFGLGATAEAALTNATGSGGAGANAKGWTLYVLASASETGHLPKTAHMTSISGNVATFSENFTSAVAAGGSGFSALLVPNLFSSTQNIGMSVDTDTANTQIPYAGTRPRYSEYDLPQTLSNVTLDRIPYNTSGGASTVNLANVNMRNIPKLSSESGSGFKLSDGSLLIGNSLTPDVTTSGTEVLQPAVASLQGVASELDGETTYTVDNAPQNKFNFYNYQDNNFIALSAADGNALPKWTTFLGQSGNNISDARQLNSPTIDFRAIGGKSSNRSSTSLAVGSNVTIGKINFSGRSADLTAVDPFYAPSGIIVQTAKDRATTDNVASADLYITNTHKTSYRNGANVSSGGIPSTFIANQAGNTIIAAKPDGTVSLRPQRDYGADGSTGNATYTQNRFPDELHEFHSFLGAGYLSSKAGTLVEIQPKSGQTFDNTSGFNYDSKGNATIRISTHEANSSAKAQWDITNEQSSGNLILRDHTNSSDKVELSAARTEFSSSLRLQNLNTTQINALSGPLAGDMVFNTTLNQVCVYNGSAWQKITQSAM